MYINFFVFFFAFGSSLVELFLLWCLKLGFLGSSFMKSDDFWYVKTRFSSIKEDPFMYVISFLEEQSMLLE